jgi:shikimate dehydrogenase
MAAKRGRRVVNEMAVPQPAPKEWIAMSDEAQASSQGPRAAGPLACVVGWPVGHSRSPVIHRYWLGRYGIAGDYVIHPVEPEKVAAFFAGFAEGPFVGCNVTVPHKEAAFSAMDEVEAAGAAIGAVNTVWREGGRLVGTSTDVHGFLANLDEGAAGWDANPRPAIVLGAGGAARAVVWALQQRGFGPVYLVNRTAARAEALAVRFGPGTKSVRWDDLSRLLPEAGVIVNATSLGMTGQPALPIDLSLTSRECLVTDLVYVPLETPLLAAAKARGLRTVDGLGMLLHQAAPGFERWFGRRPVVTAELRSAVLADLAASG